MPIRSLSPAEQALLAQAGEKAKRYWEGWENASQRASPLHFRDPLTRHPSLSDAPKCDFSGIQGEISLNLNGTPPSASLLSASTETTPLIDGALATPATPRKKPPSAWRALALYLALPYAIASATWIALVVWAVHFSAR